MGLKEPRKPNILLPIYIGIFDLAMYIVQIRNYTISARLYTYWEDECGKQPFVDSCNNYPQCHTWTDGVYKDCDIETFDGYNDCRCVAGSKLYYTPIALILSLIVTFIYDMFDKLVPLISLWKMKFNQVTFDHNINDDDDDDDDKTDDESNDAEDIDLTLNYNSWTKQTFNTINDGLGNEFSSNKISSLSNSILFISLICLNNYLWKFCIDQYYYKRLFFKYQKHHIIYYSIRYIPYIVITLYLYFVFNEIDRGIMINWYDMIPMTVLLFLNEFIKIIYRMNKPYERQEHISFILKDLYGPHISSIIWEFVFDDFYNDDLNQYETYSVTTTLTAH